MQKLKLMVAVVVEIVAVVIVAVVVSVVVAAGAAVPVVLKHSTSVIGSCSSVVSNDPYPSLSSRR